LKQDDFDYQGHLIIEKWLKVEINYINSKTSTTISLKNPMGTRVGQKNLEKRGVLNPGKLHKNRF